MNYGINYHSSKINISFSYLQSLKIGKLIHIGYLIIGIREWEFSQEKNCCIIFS